MESKLRTWHVLVLVGAVLWTLVAAGGAMYAAMAGKAMWPTIVTLDEWVVAIGLVVWFLLSSPIGAKRRHLSRRELALVLDRLPIKVHPSNQHDRSWLSHFLVILLVVFVLDLGTRAVFSLGWRPY